MATFKTIEDAINTLIKVELAEEGYLEKASNKNLDSKTANAGAANYTKYWRDLANLGLMNQGSDFAGGPAWYWCAGYQTWCFIQVFGKDLAKKLLLHLPYISCSNLGTLAEKKNQLYSTPKVGDIVLFFNGTRFSHTGFVIEVTKTQIKTSEGNTNNSKSVVPNGGAVCVKTYAISTCKSKGHKFFRPDYSLAVKATSTDTKNPTTTKKKEATINTVSSPLRCRKDPKSSGTCVGSFQKGSTVEILEKTTTSWWKVTGKGLSGKTITGYCASRYLKEKISTTTTKTPVTTTTKKKEATINTISSSLRCRKDPNSSGTIIGSFQKGSTVEILEKTTTSWWKVTGKDLSGKTITGYCASQYLKEK